MYSIYLISNFITNNKYVGITGRLNQRFSCHKNELQSGRHKSFLMKEDFKKYGKGSFGIIVIKRIENKKEALKFEADAIKVIQPEYNINGKCKHPSRNLNAWASLFRLASKKKGRVDPLYLTSSKSINEINKQAA